MRILFWYRHNRSYALNGRWTDRVFNFYTKIKMRPIKFRAWLFNEKKMLEVDELNHIASWSFEWMLWVNGVNRTIWIQWGKHNDCVVMQSTWLRDKNGRDIYEWDIVKRDDKSDGRYWRFAVVELNPDIQFNCSLIKEVDWIKNSSDYTFRYWQFAYKDTENYLTIIGNIYENPELINT